MPGFNRTSEYLIGKMRYIIYLFLSIITGLSIVRPIEDPDLWWHIVVGRWIIFHQTVPLKDYWSMFGEALPWRAYSWPVELLFAYADMYSASSLIILKLIFAALLSVSLFLIFSRFAANTFIGFLFAALTVFGCVNNFSLRPQVLTWIYFLVSIFLAERLRKGEYQRRHCIWALLLGCFWANTHITTILGIGVLLLWPIASGNRFSHMMIVVSFIIGTFITPYWGGEWLTFFGSISHPTHFSSIKEFQSVTLRDHGGGIFIILLTLVITIAYSVLDRIPKGGVLLSLVFGAIGISFAKFLPYSLILIASLGALSWQLKERNDEGLDRLRILFEKFMGNGLAFLLLCLIVVQVHIKRSKEISETLVPVESYDFIESEKLGEPILSSFAYGGYSMYRLSDSKGDLSSKVPIDGRTNLISKDYWEGYQKFAHGFVGWKELLDRVQPKTIVWRSPSPVETLLVESGQWCRVFRSGGKGLGFSVLIPISELQLRSSRLHSIDCSVGQSGDIS